MKGLTLLHRAQPALHALLIADRDPTVQILRGEVLPAAELVQEMHDHLALSGVARAVIGVSTGAVQVLHLLGKQLIGDEPLAICLEQLPYLKIGGCHSSLLSFV